MPVVKSAEIRPLPEFAAGDHGAPLVIPEGGRYDVDAIEIQIQFAAPGIDFRPVPFADRLYGLSRTGDEVIEIAGMVLGDLAVGVAIVIQYLHLGTRPISLLVFSLVILDIKKDAAIAAGGYLPFQLQIEIAVDLITEQVAVFFSRGLFEVENAILYAPKRVDLSHAIAMPAIGGATIE